MIRIRYSHPPERDSQMRRWKDVDVVYSPTVIALECEKNSVEQSRAVDRKLRPVFAKRWREGVKGFDIVSVETRAGCNCGCSFCPVSKLLDPREPGEMPMDLITKIAHELQTLRFTGRVALFGNNEPLFDDRITDIVRVIRDRLPSADIRILTNGTRTTIDLVHELFASGLSTLIINNYTDGERLLPPVKSMLDEANSFATDDIRICVRNRDDVLTTRAGLAPNKPMPTDGVGGFCALPFTDLHVSYTGDVNLCCFDAYGQVSIGNVHTATLSEIWTSKHFAAYRQRLLEADRSGLTLCSTCDFDGFRDPDVHRDPPLVREDL